MNSSDITSRRRVCIFPKMERGGPATFRRNLASRLQARGIDVTHDLREDPLDAVLVINGTRHLQQLWGCRRRGVRIIQRLGIPNSQHYPLLANLHLVPLVCARNAVTRFIRNNLADHIIYQSRFASEQWQIHGGLTDAPSTIIHNGVDLRRFSPEGEIQPRKAQICILNVEGTQGDDPFDIATNLGLHIRKRGKSFEIIMFGTPWNDATARLGRHPFIRYQGHVDAAQLPSYYRGADVFVPTDIWAGCPNSVLEALACGVPVLGHEAGVLPELINESAGRCVPCEGGRFIKGRSPGNWDALAEAALELVEGEAHFRCGARRLAEKHYDLDSMVDRYISILFP